MQLYIPLPHLQSINLSSALAQRSGISAPDRNKESEKYDKYAANDLFDILANYQYQMEKRNQKKIDDLPETHNYLGRYRRDLRSTVR